MSGDDRMRVDVWLWRARFFKTRGAAAAAVETGLRIERDGLVRRIDKPAASVRPGDLLSLNAPSGLFLVRIVSLPVRRGPSAEAAMCYERVEPSTGTPA